MNRQGMTLLEIMVSMTIMVFIMGVLFTLTQSLGETTRMQNAKITAGDDARRGMQFMVKELRNAVRQSIAWGEMPFSELNYRVVEDSDGNGVAVDVNGNRELSDVRTLSPDFEDLNSDGLTATQLVLTDGDTSRVITNNLRLANDDPVSNINGILFEQVGNGLRVTIQTEASSGAGGHTIPSSMSEIIYPRN